MHRQKLGLRPVVTNNNLAGQLVIGLTLDRSRTVSHDVVKLLMRRPLWADFIHLQRGARGGTR